MKSSNLIDLNAYRPPETVNASGMDLGAYERRGLRRYRRASICSLAALLVDSLVSAVIGVCVCLCTLVFFTML